MGALMLILLIVFPIVYLPLAVIFNIAKNKKYW